MRSFWTMFKRELASFFFSPIIYVVGGLLMMLLGWTFVLLVLDMANGEREAPVTTWFFNMFWLPALILPAVISMRLLAEEKKTGTLEMLVTAPVTDWQIVLSKFFAGLAVYAIVWVPSIFYGLALRFLVGASAGVEFSPLFCSFFGVVLNASVMIGFGILASSVTRNQIIAAVLTFVFVFVYLIIPEWIKGFVYSGPLAEGLSYISIFDHLKQFQRAIIGVQPLIFYVTATYFFLFWTVRMLESRKWK
ncbi:MAG: ABC transporter permease [Verrucomicrobiota bacterium]|nr:ABC transporter permease [Verrucomicrobiota bacterium]